MDVLSDHFTHRREHLQSARQRLSNIITFAWDAYSKSCPSSAYEMASLIFLCIIVSLVISGCVCTWMVFSLSYAPSVAIIVTGAFACVLLLLSVLVHPVRCIITVAVPSLGTKQGRKIILSTLLLYVITTCVPNIIQNVALSLHMLKCSAETVTKSVIESNFVPYTSFYDVSKFVANKIPNHSLNIEKVDMDVVNSTLSNSFLSLKEELARLPNKINLVSQILKKLVAALFMILMISSSFTYVKGYLTYIKYDNVYQSQQLLKALKRVSNDDTLPMKYKKKLVKTSGVKMRMQELQHGLLGLLSLTFYALLCGLILGLDHFVFWTQQQLLTWTADVPEIQVAISIEISLNTNIKLIDSQVSKQTMEKSYPYTVPMLPPECIYSPSAPDGSAFTSICLFLIVSFIMLLVEVFASRLRRKVCASFYPSREEHRTQYLLTKVLDSRSRDNEC